MKLLAFAGVILAGLAAVVNGVSADIKDRGASIARSTVNDAETVKIRDNATAIVSPLMTTRKCSPGGDDILSCQSGSCTKMASCEWPTLCCVTDLANVDPVGCHCKIDTRTSPSQDLDQAGKPAISDEKNTLNWSAKPWYVCFSDMSGYYMCLAGFCGAFEYCAKDHRCWNFNPAKCIPKFTKEQTMAVGCRSSCRCNCIAEGGETFCPCLESLDSDKRDAASPPTHIYG